MPDVFRTVLQAEGASVRRVELIGELDLAGAAQAFTSLVRAAGSVVVADLDRLCFIDVTGIRALLEAKAVIEAAGHHLRVRRARPAVRRVFELCELADLLERQ